MKHGGPLLGYNNNIPYNGEVYHVQTEDSGTKRPHVFTHLFADGGRIIKTKKTSYAHLLEDDPEDLAERIRALMKEQHKSMVISLRDGDLDHLIDPDGDADPSERVEVVDPAAMEAARDAEAAKKAKAGPSKRPSAPGSERPAGGAYSYVGEHKSAPAPGSKPGGALPRRMRPTGRPAADEDAPPAVDDISTGKRRRPLAGPFGRKLLSGRRLDETLAAFLAK